MPDRPFRIFALVWPIQMVKIIWKKTGQPIMMIWVICQKLAVSDCLLFKRPAHPENYMQTSCCADQQWPSSINCRRIGGRRKEEAGGETSYVVQVRFVIDEIFRLLMDVWVLQFFIVSGQVLEISDILLFRFAHFEKKFLLCSGLQGSSKAWCSLCDRCLWIRW